MSARPLRLWQARALEVYEGHQDTDFLVTATPGAGKTTFALAVAERLLRTRRIDRLIVVCPTDHLRTQWARAAGAVGIPLDPTLSNAVGPVSSEYLGYVTTYAQVAGKPLLHRRRVEARRTLVVLDEIHHAGDGRSWGEAVYEAFEPARARVSMTGTPFRTNVDERIPFVRYVPDGSEGARRSDADVTYGYREALADSVVRPVVFAAYSGVSRWRNSAGEVISASLSEPMTRDAELQAWRTALDPRGKWVPHVIAAMDDNITRQRDAGVRDAAGLVLASDQESARAYARIVKKVTGHAAVVITSDDPRASKRIAEFTHSDERIAVCVRMVSEGVDIPRAVSLCWLTSYRTPLFFAQAVGRVVRARVPGETATVFLPAVRPLLALAAAMEEDRNHVLRAPAVGAELLEPLPRLPGEGGAIAEFEALDAEARFAHVLHSGRAVVAESAGTQPSADDEDFLGLPGLLTPEQTAALLASRDDALRRRVADSHVPLIPMPRVDPDPAAAPPETWEHVARLRRDVNSLVARVAARTGAPHAVVHARLRAAVPGPPSASAPVETLSRRRDHLLTQL